jgi:hypothetical protein
MKFYPAPNDLETGQIHRLVSENGVVFIGVYRVLYGFRVRAGYSDDLIGCSIDWCGGNNWKDLERLYSLAVAILSQRKENRFCFEGLPFVSSIKPFYLDEKFTKTIVKAAGSNFEMISLPMQPSLFV